MGTVTATIKNLSNIKVTLKIGASIVKSVAGDGCGLGIRQSGDLLEDLPLIDAEFEPNETRKVSWEFDERKFPGNNYVIVKVWRGSKCLAGDYTSLYVPKVTPEDIIRAIKDAGSVEGALKFTPVFVRRKMTSRYIAEWYRNDDGTLWLRITTYAHDRQVWVWYRTFYLSICNYYVEEEERRGIGSGWYINCDKNKQIISNGKAYKSWE